MKTINLAIFGIGNVGSTLINQINALKTRLYKEQNIKIKIPVITNSNLAFYANDTEYNWQMDFELFSKPYKIKDVINYFKSISAENCMAIDVTASSEFVENYEELIENGFHIISANKVANTLSFEFYERLRKVLKKNNKKFLYETNVGAGLPVIETVKSLHESGEDITKIRGVFSGSLSYIFNRFSEEELPFDEILNSAANEGLTEPDPRDDLSGKDVARKLLILARELGLKNELHQVKIESLVPKQLNGKTTLKQFNERSGELNIVFENSKKVQKPESVLRYIGELDTVNNSLEVKLISEPKSSVLGQLKGADTLFEFYTESYNKQPLVIQGAGAGRSVTARGVLSDILKLASQLH
ncbi:aspartate kinase [Winogradskyella sp. UBA3174]|uniref:aspartate kinase n=1 Tax=Winogradskyella sp. UBA3174 TaxID=1947785 RepID=UPI0025DA7BFB|nr:aspartate kinase [Winogradskyella sp. UBA3174]|tara:strand:+ start:37911 stop:38981 length:1071 start_codon:yes stop_codon:yes gene_type:complete